MVADVYLRTVATMDKLRETLRDEHSFLIQVGTCVPQGTQLVLPATQARKDPFSNRLHSGGFCG